MYLTFETKLAYQGVSPLSGYRATAAAAAQVESSKGHISREIPPWKKKTECGFKA
jgi:hypothetical protein